jgi:hypothetical protein
MNRKKIISLIFDEQLNQREIIYKVNFNKTNFSENQKDLSIIHKKINDFKTDLHHNLNQLSTEEAFKKAYADFDLFILDILNNDFQPHLLIYLDKTKYHKQHLELKETRAKSHNILMDDSLVFKSLKFLTELIKVVDDFISLYEELNKIVSKTNVFCKISFEHFDPLEISAAFTDNIKIKNSFLFEKFLLNCLNEENIDEYTQELRRVENKLVGLFHNMKSNDCVYFMNNFEEIFIDLQRMQDNSIFFVNTVSDFQHRLFENFKITEKKILFLMQHIHKMTKLYYPQIRILNKSISIEESFLIFSNKLLKNPLTEVMKHNKKSIKAFVRFHFKQSKEQLFIVPPPVDITIPFKVILAFLKKEVVSDWKKFKSIFIKYNYLNKNSKYRFKNKLIYTNRIHKIDFEHLEQVKLIHNYYERDLEINNLKVISLKKKIHHVESPAIEISENFDIKLRINYPIVEDTFFIMRANKKVA